MSDLHTYASDALAVPRDFAYSGDLDLGNTWALGPVILTRDSDPLEASNAAATVAAIEAAHGPEDEESGWVITRCSHWAVGWVEHLSFRALEEDGTPSRQCATMQEIEAALADYPVLDEEDYSRREYEQQCEEIEDAARKWVAANAPDEWVQFVFDAAWDAAWDAHEREWRRFFEDSTNYSPPEGRVMAETVVRACIAWMAKGDGREPETFLDREEYDYHNFRPMADGSLEDLDDGS